MQKKKTTNKKIRHKNHTTKHSLYEIVYKISLYAYRIIKNYIVQDLQGLNRYFYQSCKY